ncbi:S-layer homology domain-containing protein [Bifidobacterium myosotis]|uniref:S-layer homology domain-containing protein n=1 Tax=Bifidobacterium myosotis TaxID=1630166 RepID=A0A5M9ZH23_9BIFI|nr:S-layer homology domain-containing protein [Bifidobacterium myosotis]
MTDVSLGIMPHCGIWWEASVGITMVIVCISQQRRRCIMVTHSQSMYSLPVTVKRVFGVVAAAAMALTSGALMTGQAVADDSTEAFRANAQLAAAVDYYRSTAGDYQSFLHTPAIAERPVRDAVNGTSDNLTLDDAGGRYDTDTRYYVTYRYTLQPGRALSVTVSNADDDDISLWRMFTLAVHQDGVPADQADSLIIHDKSNGGVGGDAPVHSFSGGFRWDANHRGQTAVDWIKNGGAGASVDSIYNRVCALTGAPQNVGGVNPVYNIPRGSDSETLGVRNSTNSAQTITVSVLPGTLERRSGGNGTWNVRFSEGSFTDVNNGTAHAADIEWLASSGISTGYGDGSFGVGQQVQRQDMAAFLYRLAGNPSFTPSAEDKARFSDVNENTAHAKEVWWLASTGISTGYADGTFGVGKMVQRQDMAAFLHRFAGKFGGPAESGAGITFTDVNGSTAHAEDIAWLAKTGISTGYPDHTFGVGQPVQRQDMAAFLHRIKTNA